MKLKILTAIIITGISSTFSGIAIAAPEQVILGSNEYVLVDSTINGCRTLSNETPGVVVIFQLNPTPGGYTRTLWSLYDTWNALQEEAPNLAFNPNPNPGVPEQFLGCYRLERLDANAATAPLPASLVDCVADPRFEGMVKHVYRNDPTRIDWITAYPLSNGSGGIGVEEYVAVPMNGTLETLFHGAYSVFPDNSTMFDWGTIDRTQLTYAEAQGIVGSWDAPYCRREIL